MTTTTTITNMTIMTTTIIKVHMTVSKGKESEKKTLCLLGINQVGRKPVLKMILSLFRSFLDFKLILSERYTFFGVLVNSIITGDTSKQVVQVMQTLLRPMVMA